MKTIRSVRLSILSALAVAGPILAATANAQSVKQDSTRAYAGGNYGGFKDRGGEFDDENMFKEVVIGLRFNTYFALEGSFADWGDYTTPLGSVAVNGYGLAGQGSLPISDTTSVYAKAGLFFSSVDLDLVGFEDSYSERRPFYGVGVDFAVFDPLIVSLEYDRYKTPSDNDDRPINLSGVDSDLDTIKLGVKFMF